MIAYLPTHRCFRPTLTFYARLKPWHECILPMPKTGCRCVSV
ncbi:hypothetical protein ADIMK_1032 [Marinobacterium lacunae]|uniref:Uncharacterized protein n=1 Tax=Marinobacterium lacunae TaxID=1232683 RepID=A0A081G1C4_9GAMM|nr:hypothetical protein ADIMK_1032 [Marinobacterium lacunae]